MPFQQKNQQKQKEGCGCGYREFPMLVKFIKYVVDNGKTAPGRSRLMVIHDLDFIKSLKTSNDRVYGEEY